METNPAMTHKKRLLAAVKLDFQEYVPTAFHNSAVVAELSGLPYHVYFRSGEAMAEAHIKSWEPLRL